LKNLPNVIILQGLSRGKKRDPNPQNCLHCQTIVSGHLATDQLSSIEHKVLSRNPLRDRDGMTISKKAAMWPLSPRHNQTTGQKTASSPFSKKKPLWDSPKTYFHSLREKVF
jgi:hypothetical protein